MSTRTDIITRLHGVEQNGSKSDKRLATLALTEPDFTSMAAISDIAARVGVSEPTVTRFCRNLGCDGLRDFKIYLAQAIAIGGRYLEAETPNRDKREQRIASVVSEAAIMAIQQVTNAVDMAVVMGVAEQIAAADNVLCFGSGGSSSMMATEMQNRLFRLGLSVQSQVDGQLQRMYAATAKPGTVVISFSLSGYARSVIEAIEIAKQYGAATVAITAPESDLARMVDTAITLKLAEEVDLYKPTSSRYALLTVVDLIATAVAESRGPRILEGLRRIKHSLNVYKVNDPRLPLGD